MTRLAFNSDGTYTREQKTRVKVQSEAGVQQWGVLNVPYQGSVEQLEIEAVRVKKPGGTEIVTPADSIQDLTSEVSREAPFYSDLREKHVAVKGLGPGDTLEFAARWQVQAPLAPGQFWFTYEFTRGAVNLDDRLEISVPAEREVKTKSQKVQPIVREEGGRRIYTWKSSNLESSSGDDDKEEQNYQAARGLLPVPDVLISSFRSWEEVGRWYGSLQDEKIQPSPEIRAKAEELTKGLADDDAKLRAIYNYVSLHYRYIGIAFGIGRYQPHSAAEILGNQYGDCKDKHTLLAALSSAAGIHVYPALINSRRAIEMDVPSPAQFDHVISVVARGNELSWMDTTSEVASFGHLLSGLRDKPALAIIPGKIEFRTTPASLPFPGKEEFTVTGTLDFAGTLTAHVESSNRSDGSLLLRHAFRRIPQAQWKELVQRISYGANLGGTVSNVRASTEKSDEPFILTYDYTLKDFFEKGDQRIVAPLPPFGLPAVKEEQSNRTAPLWMGAPGEWTYESRIELPKGFAPRMPASVDLKESFADFQGRSEMQGNVLVTKRHLVLKSREISPSQLKSYQTFQKAVSDDRLAYIYLNEGTDLGDEAQPALRGVSLLRKAFTELPASANLEALAAEKDAVQSAQGGDLASAIAALKHALALDPKFARGWIELGTFYAGIQQKTSELEAFRKAVDAEPKQAVTYKILAFSLTDAGRRPEAIATWQKLQGVAPDDREIATNLGMLYMAEKRYKDAGAMFDVAARNYPYNADWQVQLGSAALHSGEAEKGLAAMRRAVEIDSGAETLNNVAYEMAEADAKLSDALEFSKRSVEEVEAASKKTDVDNVQVEDLVRTRIIGSYWDTLGWIYFKLGNLPLAESYLVAAWHLTQEGVAGDHLGQVYEKEKKLTAALHVYSLALGANPRLEDTPARMRKLARVPLPSNGMSAGAELSQMRTVKLPKIVNGTASADFCVLLAPGGKVEGASFIRGSEVLRDADDNLQKIVMRVPFPSNSTARLARKGILSCSSYTGCSFVFYPASDVTPVN